MKSTTSSSNKFISVLKNQFKYNLVLFIVCQVISFIINLGIMQTMYMMTGIGYTEQDQDVTLMIKAALAATTLLGIMFAFGIVLRSFKPLYSKRASDMYLSLPVRRETMFSAVYAVSVITVLAANIIAFVESVVFVGLFQSTTIDGITYKLTYSMPQVLSTLGILFAISLASISIFMLFAVLSGKVWHYILFCYMYFSWIGSLGSSIVLCLNQIWGFQKDGSLAGLVNPLNMVMFAFFDNTKYLLITLAIALVEAVGFFVLAYFLFKKRKSEIAEFTVSGKVLPLVIVSLMQASLFLSVCMSYDAFGMLLHELFGTEMLNISAILAVIATLVATAIIAATFLNKRYSKLSYISLAIVLVVCGAYVGITKYAPFDGYVTYVPEASEVEYIEFSEGDDYYYGSTFSGMIIDSILLDEEGTMYKLESDEAISAAIALHKTVASNEFKKSASSFDDVTKTFTVTYKLKNGVKVTRNYTVPDVTVHKELNAVMQTEDIIRQRVPFTLKDENILFVSFYTYNGAEDDISEEYYKIKDYDAFRSVLLKDYMSETEDEYTHRINNDYTYGYEYLYEENYGDTTDSEVIGGEDDASAAEADGETTSEPADDYEEYDDEYYYDEYYYDSYGSIAFYLIDENAPKKAKEILHSLTPEQVQDYYMGINYFGLNPDSHYLSTLHIPVNESNVNTINYFKSLKQPTAA